MTNASEGYTVATALAGALRRHGVEAVFGQSIPSAFFLAAEGLGIRQIAYRTENAGGAMADAFARTSGRIGVVAAQNGPAATLLVAPLAEASTSSIPLLAIVQDVPTAGRDRHAFQELDHFRLFDGCAKWIRRLDDPRRVDEYVDLAITSATSGRMGPAVLLVPKDVLDRPVADPAVRTQAMGEYPLHRPVADPARVAEAARLLSAAERPLVIAGGGVHLSGAYDELERLQRLGLPVASTINGKGVVDESHPLSVGIVGHAMGLHSHARHVRELVDRADVILLVGTRTNEHDTDRWTLFPPGADIVHIDIDAVETVRNYQTLGLVGDARETLAALVDALEGVDLSARREGRASLERTIEAGRARHEEEVAELVSSPATPIRPERVMRELDRLVDAETFVVADASYSSLWMANYVRARKGARRFVSPRGLAGLGWGLPFAIGAKAANPGSPVVCVAGDGGFAHVWAELETSVREELPVVVIVLNNALLGFQKHAEIVLFGDHTSAVGIERVDHAAIARAVGARGVRVGDPAELAGALREALASGTTTVLDVVADPDAVPPITAWDDHPIAASGDLS